MTTIWIEPGREPHPDYDTCDWCQGPNTEWATDYKQWWGITQAVGAISSTVLCQQCFEEAYRWAIRNPNYDSLAPLRVVRISTAG